MEHNSIEMIHLWMHYMYHKKDFQMELSFTFTPKKAFDPQQNLKMYNCVLYAQF